MGQALRTPQSRRISALRATAPKRDRLVMEYDCEKTRALRAARTDFLAFCMYVREDWVPNWHHKIICRILQRWGEGQIKYLIITAPPRHGKSEILSRLLPAFLFGKYAHTRVMTASYAATLAEDFNRDVQRIMMSPLYHEVFPNIWLNERNRVTVADGSWLRNSQTFEVVGTDMYYKCAGVEGSLTGKGGNRLILDDFLKDWADAHSECTLESQWDWFRSVFLTRAAKDASFAATVTRWSHDDLIGRFVSLKKKLGTMHDVLEIDYPAIQDREPTWWDPRPMGEPLWPDMFNEAFLAEVRDIQGSRIFEAMYQQRPTIGDGEIVKRGWWKYYVAAELPDEFDIKYFSLDLTFDDDQKNDFVAIQVWGKVGAQHWLIDQVRERMSFVRSLAVVKEMHKRHKPDKVLIEKAANGAAMYDTIKKHLPGCVPVKPGSKSKATRMEAAAPQIEAGNVYLPKEASWLGAYIEEFAEFPNGKNDDQVDATSQYLNSAAKAVENYDFEPVSISKKSAWNL